MRWRSISVINIIPGVAPSNDLTLNFLEHDSCLQNMHLHTQFSISRDTDWNLCYLKVFSALAGFLLLLMICIHISSVQACHQLPSHLSFSSYFLYVHPRHALSHAKPSPWSLLSPVFSWTFPSPVPPCSQACTCTCRLNLHAHKPTGNCCFILQTDKDMEGMTGLNACGTLHCSHCSCEVHSFPCFLATTCECVYFPRLKLKVPVGSKELDLERPFREYSLNVQLGDSVMWITTRVLFAFFFLMTSRLLQDVQQYYSSPYSLLPPLVSIFFVMRSLL